MKAFLYKKYQQLVQWQKHGNHPVPMSGTSEESVVCLNCGTSFQGRFCPQCGQSAKVGRLSIRQGVEDLLGAFSNFDRGLFHTCFELVVRPGYMMRDYWEGHRREYVKPLTLLFGLATMFVALHFILYGKALNSGLSMPEAVEENSPVATVINQAWHYICGNRALFYLALITMLVLPNKLCFRFTPLGKTTSISEHFFAMVFVGCQMLMIDIVKMPFERLSGIDASEAHFSMSLLLLIWDFHQLFQASLRKTVFLTVVSNVLMYALLIGLVFTFVFVLAVSEVK